MKVFALVATALAMAGCSLFAAQKPPDPTTKILPAEARAAQSHTTTPASNTVTNETTIEIKLPPPPQAPLAPVNPIPTPAAGEAGSAGGAPAAALFTPGRLGQLLALAPRAIALSPMLLAQVTIDGKRIEGAPAGSTITVKDKTTTTKTDAAVDARAAVSGKGPGLETDSQQGAAGFEAGAPDANLPPMPGAAKGAATGGASGGETQANLEWKQLVAIPGTGMNLFQVLGVILLLGAVGVFVAGRGFPGVGLLTGPLAGVLAAVGGASLALGFLLESPWWVKALVIGVPVAGGVIYLVPRVRTIARKLDNDGKTIDELNKVVNATVVGIEEGDTTGEVKKAVHVASAGWRDDVDRVVQRVLRESGFGYGAASDAAKKS